MKKFVCDQCKDEIYPYEEMITYKRDESAKKQHLCSCECLNNARNEILPEAEDYA